jgi:predicted component of type VI protein secretion system
MGRAKDQFVSDGYLIGSDLAYMSVLATNIRTAHGLISFLAGRLNLGSIEMEQCVLRWVNIPKSQRLNLGGLNLESRTLGAGALLGQRCRDMTGKFNLIISVNSADKLKDLMPRAALRHELEAAVDRYLTAPLVYD